MTKTQSNNNVFYDKKHEFQPNIHVYLEDIAKQSYIVINHL